MKQEEKQLLLADLCARLPYKTMIQCKEWVVLTTTLKVGHISRLLNDDLEVKPCLRPMSSMTNEEVDEFMEILSNVRKEIQDDTLLSTYRVFDFCNAKHLDYRGLIKKGLAIEVNESNNPY